MQLGWIDFSKSERRKVLSVLDLLTESATLDELGIAPIRDGFANIFFPGTSTVQTRAKYFLIVPYALKELGLSRETNTNRVMTALDDIEKQCGLEFLRQNADENGIIGKRSLRSNSWVKRAPSDIYWSGLRKYGIFIGGNLSLSEYVRACCALKEKRTNIRLLGNRRDDAEDYECDDKNAGELPSSRFWNIPLYTTDWRNELTLKLTKAEGEFLKEQIVLSCKDSMLAYVLNNNLKSFTELKSFRELEKLVEDMPSQLREDYHLASEFSEFIYAIRVVYNQIVSDGKNEQANYALEGLEPFFTSIASLDIVFIMDRLGIFANPLLKRFLINAQSSMLEHDIDTLKECIISREVQLKGAGRAKTAHHGEFDESAWIGGGRLDYRLFSAMTIVRDIFESEEQSNA